MSVCLCVSVWSFPFLTFFLSIISLVKKIDMSVQSFILVCLFGLVILLSAGSVQADDSFSLSAVAYPLEEGIQGSVLQEDNPGQNKGLSQNGMDDDPSQPDCIRINMTNVVTNLRHQNVILCSMFSPDDLRIKVEFILDCMAKSDIYVTDEDMVGFISVHPYHECISSMHEDDDEHTVITNLRNKDTKNMTLSSTICVELYASKKHRERGEFYETDLCFSEDPRLQGMTLNKHGMAITSADEDILKEIFLEQCYMPEVEEGLLETIPENHLFDIRSVSVPDQCKRRKFKDFLITESEFNIIYNVGVAFSGAGIVGSILLFSALLGKEFCQNHNISPLLALQVAFNICLLGMCFKKNYEHIADFSQDHIGSISRSCLVGLYFFTMTSAGTVQVMFAIAIERWYAVAHPFSHRVTCNMKFNSKISAFIITTSNLLAILIVLLAYFFEFTGMCKLSVQGDVLLAGAIFSIIWSVLLCVIPWLFIFVFTGLTGWKLVRLAQARRRMTSQEDRHPKNLISVSCVLCRECPQWTLWAPNR